MYKILNKLFFLRNPRGSDPSPPLCTELAPAWVRAACWGGAGTARRVRALLLTSAHPKPRGDCLLRPPRALPTLCSSSGLVHTLPGGQRAECQEKGRRGCPRAVPQVVTPVTLLPPGIRPHLRGSRFCGPDRHCQRQRPSHASPRALSFPELRLMTIGQRQIPSGMVQHPLGRAPHFALTGKFY